MTIDVGIYKRIYPALIIISFLCCTYASAQDEIQRLKKLSIEELMNVEVTSVSRLPQRLSEVASAIQVITNEDIRRSGATNIPEALRLASNLQVAQLNSSAWIISARGFNTVFANKLLVLIDGRTVYTPLFAGVLWEMQNVLLEDVERIEVISGPGASMWGANAVNGVINIITKKSTESTGVYASVAKGNFFDRAVAARYGAKLNDKTGFRLFVNHAERAATRMPDKSRNLDRWQSTQVGFRVDSELSDRDELTIQGDINVGENEATLPLRFDTQNILTRWTRSISENSQLAVQLYYDRYWRDDKAVLADELKTYDFEIQHTLNIRNRHKFIYGGGYRLVDDVLINRSAGAGLLPTARVMPLYSIFVQDEISWTAFKLTLGTRILHNYFSGFEYQPTLRVSATLDDKNMIWGAASRAVRAPSRFDVDYVLPVENPIVRGTTDFKSEHLYAFEAGYRSQLSTDAFISLATFYNDYRDVYSVEFTADKTQLFILNGSRAETWGAEFSGLVEPFSWWKLKGGFTYFGKDLRAKRGRDHDPSYLTNDAKHHARLHTMFTIHKNLEVDVIFRYFDFIPASFATARVPEYATIDARVAWKLNQLEFAVVGQNLYKKYHREFGSNYIPRGLYGRVTCRF